MGAQLIAGGVKDSPQVQGTAFTVTDANLDYALDCNTDNAAAIADVLATVIFVLIQKGILKGTVTTL